LIGHRRNDNRARLRGISPRSPAGAPRRFLRSSGCSSPWARTTSLRAPSRASRPKTAAQPATRRRAHVARERRARDARGRGHSRGHPRRERLGLRAGPARGRRGLVTRRRQAVLHRGRRAGKATASATRAWTSRPRHVVATRDAADEDARRCERGSLAGQLVARGRSGRASGTPAVHGRAVDDAPRRRRDAPAASRPPGVERQPGCLVARRRAARVHALPADCLQRRRGS
jgi:hypothetical protein